MHQNFIPFRGWMIFHCTDIWHFVYPFVSWSFRLFLLLAIMSNASMNICVQVFIWSYVFNSLGYIPRRRITGLYGSYFLQQLYHFTFLPTMSEGSNFTISLSTLVTSCNLFFFFIIAILVGVKLQLSCNWLVSLMTLNSGKAKTMLGLVYYCTPVSYTLSRYSISAKWARRPKSFLFALFL